jgi:hypothetical protein
MTEFIQRFLLNNTKGLQNLVNNKLAKRGGAIGKFFSWMEIGPRNHGTHVIPRWFRFWNSYMLILGWRFNWARPHLTKLATKEREIFMAAYSGVVIGWAWLYRKNKIRPLNRYQDYHLYDYDNPTTLTKTYNMYIPFNVNNFKISAHYLEINKIVFQELWKKFQPIKDNIEKEFSHASEKTKRTKYATNPNYVYEAFGWEGQTSLTQ